MEYSFFGVEDFFRDEAFLTTKFEFFRFHLKIFIDSVCFTCGKGPFKGLRLAKVTKCGDHF